MLQHNIFPIYEKKQCKLIDGYVYRQFEYCSKCFSNPNKRCIKFYEKLISASDGLYSCPYGLSAIVYKDNIITTLLINDLINNKTKENFKEELKGRIKFSKNEVECLIKANIDRDLQLETYRESVHDLRNMASYFNAMVDEYLLEKAEEKLMPIEKSFISLYELINFRLDILYGTVDLTNIIEKEQKIHPLVVKLTYLLKYKAKQKNINFQIEHIQKNSFNITKSLYLALFILMENAVKYAKPGSEIKINFNEINTSTEIIIINISNKINEINGNSLLEKGVRGSNGIGVGSGIGLAMANELLENMNSSLSISLETIDDVTTKFITTIKLNNF